MTSSPTIEQLLEVVSAQLEEELLPGLEGRERFLVRLATGALRVAERELALGDAVAELERDSAAAAGLPTSAEGLASVIRESASDVDPASLRDHLVRSVLARLAIDNPSYPSLVEARVRWLDLASDVDAALG